MGFIDAKDTTTNGHSMRVAQYARKLAWKIGFSQEECDRVYYISLMHDCGKIGIPDAILNKSDKLTVEEFDVMNSERCYQHKMTKEDIIDQLQINKGKQFDPKLVDSFLEMLADKTIEF